MFTQIFSYIGSFLNFRSESGKRQRSDSEEFYPATFTPTPRKRLRLTDLMADNTGPPKSAVGTQTQENTFVAQAKSPQKSPRGFYDMQSKENWGTPQTLKLTPRKGLSSSFYKSPSRSPRSSQVGHDMSDVKCTGVFRNPSSSRQILTGTPSGKMSGKIIKFKSRPKLKTSFLQSRTEATFRDAIDMDGKEAYSKLLGAFMRHNKQETVKQTVVDLTSEEKEEINQCIDLLKHNTPEVVDLTRDLREGRKQKKNNVSNVICIDDSDDDVIEVKPTEKITHINSMQSKLKQVPCTSPSWLNDILDKHTKAMRDIKLESERREKGKNVSAANLHKEIEKLFLERTKKHLAITSVPILEEEKVEEPTKLPELTPSMQDKIASWLSMHGSSEEILVEKFNYQIRRRDLRTLRGLSWLNDEVINFYMNLIMDRSSQNNELPKSYCFNTFFYMKLLSGGHNSVKRWTRRVDVFSYDILIIPVHLKVHWCLAAIDFKKKQINYYDSMNGPNDECLNALKKYLQDERKEKKNEEFSTEGWQLTNVKGIPQQMNGSDCGMFACTFAEYLSRRAQFTFSQSEMPYFRNKMAYEIVTGELLIKK